MSYLDNQEFWDAFQAGYAALVRGEAARASNIVIDPVMGPVSEDMLGAWPFAATCPLGYDERDARV